MTNLYGEIGMLLLLESIILFIYLYEKINELINNDDVVALGKVFERQGLLWRV